MANSVNQPTTVAEQLFKDAVWTPAVTSALAQMGLNFWPFTSLASVITDKVYAVVCTMIDVTEIGFINQAHKAAFDEEELKLKVVALEYGRDSQEFQDENKKSLAALAAFVHMGPA